MCKLPLLRLFKFIATGKIETCFVESIIRLNCH